MAGYKDLDFDVTYFYRSMDHLLNPDGHFKIPHLWPGQNTPPEVSTSPQRQGKISLQILD